MSSVKYAGEGSLFAGRVPTEIKCMVPRLNQLCKSSKSAAWFPSILQLVLSALEDSPISEDDMENLKLQLTSEDLEIILAGMYVLLKTLFRTPALKQTQDFQAELKELKIPVEVIPELNSAVNSQRQHIYDVHHLKSMRLPRLTSFRWRTDVSISTSVLSRALDSTILMEMTLSTGKKCVFEVPVSKFHQLRYNVARVLRDMEEIEKRSVIKIQS